MRKRAQGREKVIKILADATMTQKASSGLVESMQNVVYQGEFVAHATWFCKGGPLETTRDGFEGHGTQPRILDPLGKARENNPKGSQRQDHNVAEYSPIWLLRKVVYAYV